MASESRGRGAGGGEGRSSLTGRKLGRRIVFTLATAGVLWFGIQSGQYSTIDLFRLRSRERVVQKSIDSLSRVVDSLTRYERRLRTDPALQERVAREVFGMVRGNKELLYRFADSIPDSTSRRRP